MGVQSCRKPGRTRSARTASRSWWGSGGVGGWSGAEKVAARERTEGSISGAKFFIILPFCSFFRSNPSFSCTLSSTFIHLSFICAQRLRLRRRPLPPSAPSDGLSEAPAKQQRRRQQPATRRLSAAQSCLLLSFALPRSGGVQLRPLPALRGLRKLRLAFRFDGCTLACGLVSDTSCRSFLAAHQQSAHSSALPPPRRLLHENKQQSERALKRISSHLSVPPNPAY